MRPWSTALSSVAVFALTLGLVAPAAHGSCAGPQISIRQGATRGGPDTYGVAPGAEITLHVTNLSKGCQDTIRPGCARHEEAAPAADVPVTVRQGSRSWQLGRVSGHGQDRSDSLTATLPAELSAGSATLAVDIGRVALKVTQH